MPANSGPTNTGGHAPQTMKGLPVQGCAVVMPSRMQLVPPSLAFTCAHTCTVLSGCRAMGMRKDCLGRRVARECCQAAEGLVVAHIRVGAPAMVNIHEEPVATFPRKHC